MKQNSSFFPTSYAIGRENSVLESLPWQPCALSRGESCLLGLSLACSPTMVLLTTGPRFGAGVQGPGQWWEQPGSLSLRTQCSDFPGGQPLLVPRLPCPSSGEPHTWPQCLPKRKEEGSSLGIPQLWPDGPSSLTDQQFPPELG